MCSLTVFALSFYWVDEAKLPIEGQFEAFGTLTENTLPYFFSSFFWSKFGFYLSNEMTCSLTLSTTHLVGRNL